VMPFYSTRLENQSWWKLTHFLGFFIGGMTFIAGRAQSGLEE